MLETVIGTNMASENSACKVVLASAIAKSLLHEVSNNLERLQRSPLLIGFLANDDPAARKYAEWTQRTCKENQPGSNDSVDDPSGVIYKLAEVDREELENCLIEANTDQAIDGVIVYYPIFDNRQDQYLQQIPDITKDVEGLSHKYIFKLYHNERYLDQSQTRKCILPCTPLAIVKILDYLGIYNNILPFGNRLFGRTVTVVNRSETVGRPLAAMLANDGALVYSVDVTGIQQFSRGEGIKKKMHEVIERNNLTLADCLKLSDVVISGVPGKVFTLPTVHLKEGAVCVNFSTEKNFEASVKDKASIFVPSIGKVTIAILLRNLVRLAQNRQMA